MNVLEIGYGSSGRSAVISGGEVFNDPGVIYFGVTLPERGRHVSSGDLEQVKPVDAHWAALPYRDSSFGTVLMRSCFGQFTHSTQYAPSQFHSLQFGLHEVARVLEPGGTLFVSEENTPDDFDKVFHTIMSAGLDVEAFEREHDRETKEANPTYANLRKRYYGDEIFGAASIGGGGLFNPRYVLEAVKPADRAFATDVIEADYLLAHRDTIDGEWKATNTGQDLNVFVPADSETLEEELRMAKGFVRFLGERYNHWLESVETRLK